MKRVLAINLGSWSPNCSSCLPAGSDEQSSSASLHGISSREVYQAIEIAFDAGGLLPHLFTLTSGTRTMQPAAVSLSVALAVSLGLPLNCLPVR